jgi:hypothetical protein
VQRSEVNVINYLALCIPLFLKILICVLFVSHIVRLRSGNIGYNAWYRLKS